ncbi:putative MarR family transcriptional regulator [Rhodococcus wratislaviensis NBRC 100605]|uniref:Putative MarR family transcriptional regulator n=1 Tax=Rhodococcus wratislaviensis NBRC 100605 TaxID=1219028 RepID=X0PW14_RHOWR|nr:putative MarR family transcriptional regulator [Rhodococcus wratislaviensis NBRC 100605]
MTKPRFDSNFDLDTMVGYLIRVSQQVHYSLWNSANCVGGLTSPQFGVLHILAHEHPLDQTALGERASLDRTTLAEIVTRLSKRGLVARTRDTGDGRRNLVTITDAGREVHDAAAGGAYEINERFLFAVPPEDREVLVRVLNQIFATHRVARI